MVIIPHRGSVQRVAVARLAQQVPPRRHIAGAAKLGRRSSMYGDLAGSTGHAPISQAVAIESWWVHAERDGKSVQRAQVIRPRHRATIPVGFGAMKWAVQLIGQGVMVSISPGPRAAPDANLFREGNGFCVIEDLLQVHRPPILQSDRVATQIRLPTIGLARL